MKIDKVKVLVNILCSDNILIAGFIHINQGERVKDFINNAQGDFIAVTEAKVYNADQHLKGELKPLASKNVVILNKAEIKWVEEAKS